MFYWVLNTTLLIVKMIINHKNHNNKIAIFFNNHSLKPEILRSFKIEATKSIAFNSFHCIYISSVQLLWQGEMYPLSCCAGTYVSELSVIIVISAFILVYYLYIKLRHFLFFPAMVGQKQPFVGVTQNRCSYKFIQNSQKKQLSRSVL